MNKIIPGIGSRSVVNVVVSLLAIISSASVFSISNFAFAVPIPQTTVFLTSGTTWTVPADWNSSSNSIKVIGGGGGGGGAKDGTNDAGAGGGGGAYAAISNLSLTPGGSVTYQIGSGGLGNTGDGSGTDGGDTYFNRTSGSSSTCNSGNMSVCAKAGKGGAGKGGNGGAGGLASGSIGDTGKVFSGGSSVTSTTNGTGGGGAAGPNGAGNSAVTTTGGSGDNGSGGSGGTSGNAGGNGTEFDATHGSGGGGGGNSTANSDGKNGGNYGAGGGGGDVNGGNGGNGAQGLIVITYTPVSTTATLTVTKIVTNNSGGTKVVSDFPLFIDGMSVTSGVASTTSQGLHTISETNQAGYTGTIGGDCALNGTITLVAGENKSCTITNDDQPGHLTIVKNTTGGNGNFLFSVSGPSASTPFISTSGLTGSSTSAVNAGTYSVTEGGQGTWDLTSASCSNGTTNGSTVSGIVIPLGGNVTCTFTNTKRGSITVNKNVVAPDGTTDIEDNHSFNVTLNGNNQKTISEGASKTYSDLIPGTYTVAEIGDPDFDLLRITAGGVDDPTPQDGALVTVVAGQDTEVTITNKQKQGHLTVKKIVTNPNGGTAVAEDFSFIINRGEPTTFIQNESDTTRGENELLVNPGVYTITERVPEGAYAVSYNNCEITVSSNGQAGGTTTCTITNSDIPEGKGAITVNKTVINDNGGTAVAGDFRLLITPEEDDSFEVSNGQANFLNPGNYTVSEDGDSNPSGYAQTSISCTNGETTTEDGSVTLGAQDAWTCTITNDDIAPKLTLVKRVNNSREENTYGFALATDWTLSASSTETNISGKTGSQNVTDVNVHTGTYTLSESNGPNGYTASDWSCEGAQNDGNEITLGLGDVATCTITNTAKPAHLTVVKKTDSESGDANFHFTVSGTGDTVFSNSFDLSTVEQENHTSTSSVLYLPAGSFDVSEVEIGEEWNLASVSCKYENNTVGQPIENGEHITVGNGDEVTCTFTNTTAPVVTAEAAVNVADTSITITWTTDHNATSRVVYDTVSHSELGEAPNYGYANSTTEDATLVTNHNVTVSGLSSGTTYYFRAVSHGSPESVSSEVSGTTSTPVPVPSFVGGIGGGGGGGVMSGPLSFGYQNGPAVNQLPTTGTENPSSNNTENVASNQAFSNTTTGETSDFGGTSSINNGLESRQGTSTANVNNESSDENQTAAVGSSTNGQDVQNWIQWLLLALILIGGWYWFALYRRRKEQ